MNTTSIFRRLGYLLIAVALSGHGVLQASVRLSGGTNQFDGRTRYQASPGWGLPEGDWTLGIWDNNFQGGDGWLINGLAGPTANGTINLVYDKAKGRYTVGGLDTAGNAFGSGGTISTTAGALPVGYAGRISGKFTPRLHIIRRRAGHSEYLVAEAGHAPVLVCSEERPFGAVPVKGWYFGCYSDYNNLYDSDLEGIFFATTAVSDRDIALMAAGYKPSNVPSISGNLTVYFPLETASLSQTANPLLLTNTGSDSSVVLKRLGSVTRFADGPMLRGAVAENNTPAEVTQPTNVVALGSLQPFQVIRHLNGSANVEFTGFDYGTGIADIEIRFLHVEQGTSTPWQTLVTGSAGEGAAIQTTLSVPKGYWKTIEVRRVNSSGGVGDSSRPNRTWCRWAVGEVVVVWGDSIQGGAEATSRANLVAPNGFTAKYPSSYPNSIPGDTNPLAGGMWNLLRGGGMGGGSQGENEIANNLSEASQCCVGITVVWAGATRLAYWNGRIGSSSYDSAKAYCLANGGLNKPNVITWVANLASAKYSDDFYHDLDLFRDVLNNDFGDGTWRMVLAPIPVIYSPETVAGASLHKVRDASWRWVRDNPGYASFAGISFDHLAADGVHPSGNAWDIMGARWGNAMRYLRAPLTAADPRAGEIVKFYRSGGNLFAEVQLYAGTALSLKDTAANISGLTLSSDNFATTIPISAATLVNGTTIRITPDSMPAGSLKLRYQFGKPGVSGNTLAAAGTDNMLYVNAGPTNIIAVQPIYGTSENYWSMAEGTPPSPPAITTGTLPTGVSGTAYLQTLAASGGLSPYTWTVASGTLPDGLTLSSAGVISGTPGSSGTANFSIRVESGDGISSLTSFSLTIVSAYAAWQATQFTSDEIAAGAAGIDADLDGDGESNLLEYAFGRDPKNAGEVGSVPIPSIEEDRLQIAFSCDTHCTDINYTVQASDSLSPDSWTDIAQSTGGAATQVISNLASVSDSGGGRRTVTVTDATALSVGTRRFLRVKVTSNFQS